MCATFPNDAALHQEPVARRRSSCVWSAPAVLAATDTCFMPTPGHPGARARVCPRMIGCCPDCHLQSTRSSRGPTHAKPLCTGTNKLEAFHTPLRSALWTEMDGRGGNSVCFSCKRSRNGGKTKEIKHLEIRGAGTCLTSVLSVVMRLLEPLHTYAAVVTDSRVCPSPFPPADGQLRHTETGEPFVFNAREDLHRWNQKRYEALGEVKELRALSVTSCRE